MLFVLDFRENSSKASDATVTPSTPVLVQINLIIVLIERVWFKIKSRTSELHRIVRLKE